MVMIFIVITINITIIYHTNASQRFIIIAAKNYYCIYSMRCVIIISVQQK